MKIRITENKLKEFIKEIIKEHLDDCPFLLESWEFTTEDFLTESLTCSYNIGKLVGLLKRKINLDEYGIKLNVEDSNYSSKDKLSITGNEDSEINKNRKTEETDNWCKLVLYFKKGIRDNKDIVDSIIDMCNAYGWFLTHYLYFERDENFSWQPIVSKNIDFDNKELMHTPIQMFFRAKFNVEYKEKSVPDLMYHIAPIRVLDKIKQQGLTP